MISGMDEGVEEGPAVYLKFLVMIINEANVVFREISYLCLLV